ncbi:conserved Plasmodium protein, unknown function [Plasmodium relictum]|uniref:Liprin-beta-1/2 coiled-coil domain-containing protein n=1 Tax=Plasmodium relictum TaxID=85471 RepID=A0A1J1H1C5_PLARL|nr:conserved Plasmodium protein, unknown function [Plasmodium relictum]CRG98626.1 conserved Plasmodium protein, unknown function [Plasmodium relictum]
MDKTSKLSSLVKNVQFFVKKCREKNKKLLTLSSLDDNDEIHEPGNFMNDKTNLDRSFKESSTINSSKCSGESKYDIYKNSDSTYSKELRRTNTEDNFHNISDYSDNVFKKKFIKLKEKDSINETFEGSDKLLDTDKNGTMRLEISKVRLKDRKMDDIKNKIMEYDLDLLKIYNKLETTAKTRSFRKKKKKKKKFRTYNSEILNVKSVSSVKKKNTITRKKVEDKNELKINFSEETSKLGSKSSFLTFGNKISKFQYISSSKKTFDEFFFFQEGLSNRLNKKNNKSSYDIGCMYMNSDVSLNGSKDLKKKKSNEMLNSSKSLRHFKFLNNNKRNIDYYKKMIENLEETIGKTKKKNNSYIDDVIKIINCLLHDYVPKLIDRYEYYMNTLDDKNKMLKQKIRESLDYGDVQYEEIRELKVQLIQNNNKNKKLNDTIETLKDKLSYTNELELKNAEYLDEIVLLRNRITFLEKIIEENDQTKESQELRRMRRKLRVIYNKMKNEMRYISTLKLKYLKKYKKRKFSINKWIYLKEKMSEKKLTMDDKIEKSSINVTNIQNENHIDIEKDIKENIIDETKKDVNKDKNKEISEKKFFLKEYTDKSVGTDDQSIHRVYEGNNEVLMQDKIGDKLKFEQNKVVKEDKEVNTVLSSDALIELLIKEKKGSGKMDIRGSIPKESYPYYHYFYSNINEDNYFGHNNENKKKICKENLNKATDINEKYSLQYSTDKNSNIGKKLFTLGNVLKNPMLNYNEKCKRFNYNPRILDKHGMFLYNNLKKCIYDNDKEKFNEDSMLKKNKLHSILPGNSCKNKDWNGINKNKNVKKCDIPIDCCNKLNILLRDKINCYLCKNKNICDSSDNLFHKKSKLKKSNILNNSFSIDKKFKLDKINRNITHTNKDNFKYKNRYNNNIYKIRNKHEYNDNINNNIRKEYNISNHNCDKEKKYEDCKINNYYDNRYPVEDGIDTIKDKSKDKNNKKNNDDQNMLKKSKNIYKKNNRHISESENKNNDEVKSFVMYENRNVNNVKKILGFHKNQLDENKKNNLINKLDNPEDGMMLTRMISSENENSKMTSKEQSHLNDREIIIIPEINGIKKNDETISQVNNYDDNNEKINSYLYANNNFNLQKNILIHKKVSNHDNMHKNNLKIGNKEYTIKKKENIRCDLSNYKNSSINTSQSMEKMHYLKNNCVSHKKELLHYPCKENKKDENFCLGEKHYRYYNSFNQYLDINKKSYGTINNYLQNHFLYIMEM